VLLQHRKGTLSLFKFFSWAPKNDEGDQSCDIIKHFVYTQDEFLKNVTSKSTFGYGRKTWCFNTIWTCWIWLSQFPSWILGFWPSNLHKQDGGQIFTFQHCLEKASIGLIQAPKIIHFKFSTYIPDIIGNLMHHKKVTD